MRRSRCPILPLLAWAGLATGLAAQEPWDASLKVSGLSVSGAQDAGLGQNTGYGVAMEGVYPLFRRGFIVAEFGYQRLFSASTGRGTVSEFYTDGFFGGLQYRHAILNTGLYAQGGLRLARYKTVQYDTTSDSGDGARMYKASGPYTRAFKPTLSVGYRFTEHLSLDVGFTGYDMTRASGAKKSGTLLEVTLGMHM